MSLKNRTYIVVGGTSGMGLESAKFLNQQGAAVLVIGRSGKGCEIAKKTLDDKAIIYQGDATKEKTIAEAIVQAHEKFGEIQGLFHVAGGSGRQFGDGPLHEMSIEGWNKTFELNLTSLMLSNKQIINYFLKHGIAGNILNMGSVLGFSPSPKYFATHAYAATKSAIIGFSKSIAAYYATNNIKINVLAPSLFSTPMAERAIKDKRIQSFIKTKQPLDGGRSGYPVDINEAVLMFLSPNNKFITGQVLAVDGGWSLSEGQLS